VTGLAATVPNIGEKAASLFREESGRILASLIRASGSFDRAEEALQEAFTAALGSWPSTGLPQNPGAWLTAAAHRKLIDMARRERTRRDKQDALTYETNSSITPQYLNLQDASMFPDDRLRLIFTCCHPALNQQSQIALTLKTLGGLSTGEIAKAFLLPEPTLAQRLVRAKRKIQEACIPYEVPSRERLPERLGSVQSVLYLIFNEGYLASGGNQLVRSDLCAEAIRLTRVVCDLMPGVGENLALLALMLLHDSRRGERMRDGKLITLEKQDRSRWDQAEIEEGLTLTRRALRSPPLGPYQLQAAIAAVHAEARTAGDTDWHQIALLYERLLWFGNSPVVALNHAVAVAMDAGLEKGLRLVDGLGGPAALDDYYLFHAARADILARMNRNYEAAAAYRRALALTSNQVEREFLLARLAEL
jgi:RNA polymerase sigma-70 factor (ECF subfamily)